VQDSSSAFSKAIAKMLEIATDAGGAYADLGGATMDLAGGSFAVSEPVVFPKGYKNFRIVGGLLRALNGSFPAGATLLHVGGSAAAKGKACMNVDISHLTVDGGDVAGSAIFVENVQYANLGPALMVFGFSEYGIRVTGSGGGFIHKSWLGQAAPDKRPWLLAAQPLPTATAISLGEGQHDWYVEDVIIWSARVGISSQNGANQIQGAHTWNLMTTKGGVGIILEKGGGKVVDSYLDFCPLVIVDPTSAVVTENLFLAKANLVLQAGSRGAVQNLLVSKHRWSSENKYINDTIVINGKFTSVSDTTVEGNVADVKWSAKSTRATQTVSVSNASVVNLDFTNDLLFDVAITEVICSIQAWEMVSHVVHPPTGRSVAVQLSKALPHGKVLCTVDQSSRTHNAH